MTNPIAGAPLRGGSILGRRRVALATGALAALGALASASAADAGRGETLARRWCATCHVVASDQARGQDNAPPFATIAQMPGFGADKIALFLLDPHPKMPDLQLSRIEREDLAAYIVSLGK